jgi:predicted amidohydrolase YtcJ
MQPTHCVADIPHVEQAWKARASRSYPWRSLLASGATLAFGSDAPVESPSVAAGLHAAVTRERRGRAAPFVPDECLTLDQALHAYTVAPARLAGLWPRVGRIAPGARADVVVWNTDLHQLPPGELADARPRWTLLDGETLFDAEAANARSGDLPMTRCAP